MGKFHKIEEMLEGELMKIGSEGKLTTSSLEVGDKAAHFLKSIKTIDAMEEAEGNSYDGDYSMRRGGRSYGYNYDGMSYARGDGRGRGSNARRDSRGRYSSEGGYSGNNKQALMMELEELKDKLDSMED